MIEVDLLRLRTREGLDAHGRGVRPGGRRP
jgi:hypothetical protein